MCSDCDMGDMPDCSKIQKTTKKGAIIWQQNQMYRRIGLIRKEYGRATTQKSTRTPYHRPFTKPHPTISGMWSTQGIFSTFPRPAISIPA